MDVYWYMHLPVPVMSSGWTVHCHTLDHSVNWNLSASRNIMNIHEHGSPPFFPKSSELVGRSFALCLKDSVVFGCKHATRATIYDVRRKMATAESGKYELVLVIIPFWPIDLSGSEVRFCSIVRAKFMGTYVRLNVFLEVSLCIYRCSQSERGFSKLYNEGS